MKISVVVANYNGKQYLKKCFESLLKQNFKGKLEIILIDDNSQDKSYEYVRKNFPTIIAYKNSKNLGHAESCNKGIEKATGQFIFLIDNDTEFDKNCLDELINTFKKDKNIGCVGGMIKDYGRSNIIQDLGVDVDIFGYGFSDIGSGSGNIIEDNNQFKKNRTNCFYISSCALLVKKEIIDKIGYFDKDYFMYKDDLDLCWRVQIAGYKIVINPKAKIYHKMGVTLGGTAIKKNNKYQTSIRKRYFGEKNTIKTLFKNYEFKNLLWIMPIYFFINIFEIIFFLASGNYKVSLAYIDAWLWNIKHLKRIISERKKIQIFRKINDKSIMKNMYFGSGKLKILLHIGIPKFK